MAVQTYTEQLLEVQTAISAVLSGAQSYKFKGRSKTAADLATLYSAEARLRILAERESAGGIRITAATPVDS